MERAKKKESADIAFRLVLIKLKTRATGFKSIPSTERVYFNVKHPKDDTTIPIYVSKLWTLGWLSYKYVNYYLIPFCFLGRTVDAVAKECKVQNNNNKSDASKLKLFDEHQKIISEDMSSKMNDLLEKKILFNGQTLILQYV